MNQQEVIAHIQAELGIVSNGTGVNVELDDLHLQAAIRRALLWLSLYMPKKGKLDIILQPGVGKYDLSGLPNEAQVVRVSVVGSSGFNAYDPWKSNILNRFPDITEFAYLMNYIQTIRSITGIDLTWEWDYPFLYIHPKPSSDKVARVEYIYPYSLVDEVPTRYLEPFLKFATAQAKKILAKIRGKYRGVPAPEGSIELDADTLLSEAQEEERQATEELRRLMPAGGIVVG